MISVILAFLNQVAHSYFKTKEIFCFSFCVVSQKLYYGKTGVYLTVDHPGYYYSRHSNFSRCFCVIFVLFVFFLSLLSI